MIEKVASFTPNTLDSYLWEIKSFHQLTPYELYKILNLRIKVFMQEQKCLFSETDFHDQEALHLWTTNNDGVISAYARILPPYTVYQETVTSYAKIGRVVVEKSARGKGLSYLLMKKAISIINYSYSADIEISAQAHLISFYQKIGFEIEGEEYLEDEIPHIKMKLLFKSQ